MRLFLNNEDASANIKQYEIEGYTSNPIKAPQESVTYRGEKWSVFYSGSKDVKDWEWVGYLVAALACTVFSAGFGLLNDHVWDMWETVVEGKKTKEIYTVDATVPNPFRQANLSQNNFPKENLPKENPNQPPKENLPKENPNQPPKENPNSSQLPKENSNNEQSSFRFIIPHLNPLPTPEKGIEEITMKCKNFSEIGPNLLDLAERYFSANNFDHAVKVITHIHVDDTTRTKFLTKLINRYVQEHNYKEVFELIIPPFNYKFTLANEEREILKKIFIEILTEHFGEQVEKKHVGIVRENIVQYSERYKFEKNDFIVPLMKKFIEKMKWGELATITQTLDDAEKEYYRCVVIKEHCRCVLFEEYIQNPSTERGKLIQDFCLSKKNTKDEDPIIAIEQIINDRIEEIKNLKADNEDVIIEFFDQIVKEHNDNFRKESLIQKFNLKPLPLNPLKIINQMLEISNEEEKISMLSDLAELYIKANQLDIVPKIIENKNLVKTSKIVLLTKFAALHAKNRDYQKAFDLFDPNIDIFSVDNGMKKEVKSNFAIILSEQFGQRFEMEDLEKVIEILNNSTHNKKKFFQPIALKFVEKEKWVELDKVSDCCSFAYKYNKKIANPREHYEKEIIRMWAVKNSSKDSGLNEELNFSSVD